MTPEQWHQVKELFDAALEREPEARRSFLDGACNGDEELLREVASLLNFDHEAAAFIEAPAIAAVPEILAEAQSASLAGQRIGPYQILKEIGHGGMGAVYLAARADDQYKKQVAIKLVRQGFDNQFIVTRFLAERQILANLDHKNIGRLLDGGTTEQGSPYLVMEYIEGVPADKYCDERKLSTIERLKLFRIVSSAVTYAHQNLVIHRDIKPSNILVTEGGTPKLLDFGIAKILSPESTVQTSQTATAVRLMTPDYASPEQVRGQAITTTSDIYSLGVLLYKLLAGHQPYRFKTPLPAEIERVICGQEPERPSTAISRVEVVTTPDGATVTITPDLVSAARDSQPEKLRRLLDGDLDNIVMMAMRKEPARRYSSVEQFSEDIRRHLEGLPVIARKDTFSYRAGKFIKRHKVAVAAAAFVVLSLVGGILTTAWQARIAQKERDKARVEAEKAGQINTILQEMLGSANPYAKGKEVTVREVLAVAATRVETELVNQPEIQAGVRTSIGNTYLGLGLFDAAEPHLRFALDTRTRLFGREHREVATSLSNLAALLQARGNNGEAEELYREALSIARKVHGNMHSDVAKILKQLGTLMRAKGDLDAAEQIHREALSIYRQVLGDQHYEVASTLDSLAIDLGTKGDLGAAEELHRETLRVLRKTVGNEHPDVAQGLGNLGFILVSRKAYEEAEALFRESLDLKRRLLGNEHPDVLWNIYYYADLLYLKGDYEQAARLSREVLGFRGKVLPDEHPITASALRVLGMSLTRKGDAKSAESFLRESLGLRVKALPPSHWLIASAESVLGGCLARLKRFAEAEPLLLKGHAGLKAKFGEEDERTVEALSRLAQLYEAWKKPEMAARYRARTLKTSP